MNRTFVSRMAVLILFLSLFMVYLNTLRVVQVKYSVE
jgi:hypothetical protein